MPFKTKEEKRLYDQRRYADPEMRKKISERKKRHYHENRERYLFNIVEWTKKRRAKHKELINNLKSAPCMDCLQIFPPCAMDFDHRPGEIKSASISQLQSNWKISEKALMAEIAKCDLVCANCHRVRTFNRLMEKKVEGADTDQ